MDITYIHLSMQSAGFMFYCDTLVVCTHWLFGTLSSHVFVSFSPLFHPFHLTRIQAIKAPEETCSSQSL